MAMVKAKQPAMADRREERVAERGDMASPLNGKNLRENYTRTQ